MSQSPFDPTGSPTLNPTPSMKQLDGRLLVIRPKLIESVPDRFSKTGEMKDRLTADVIFLDGDPITKIEKQNKPDEPLETPLKKGDVLQNMFISSGVIIGQVKGRTMVCGRLGRGLPKGTNNPPWIILERTAADDELSKKWWEKRGADFMAAASTGLVAPQPVVQPDPTPAAPAPTPATAAPQAPAQERMDNLPAGMPDEDDF